MLPCIALKCFGNNPLGTKLTEQQATDRQDSQHPSPLAPSAEKWKTICNPAVRLVSEGGRSQDDVIAEINTRWTDAHTLAAG